jgi:hypothetical protein
MIEPGRLFFGLIGFLALSLQRPQGLDRLDLRYRAGTVAGGGKASLWSSSNTGKMDSLC